jgi:maleylacetoacetate isomerase
LGFRRAIWAHRKLVIPYIIVALIGGYLGAEVLLRVDDGQFASLVPALEHDGLELTQSLAIIEWLDETFPQFPLMPEDKDMRAHVRAFAQVIACEVHPLQNLRVLQYLKNELDQPQEQLDRWCQRWIEDGLSACEGLLAKQNHSGKYCFGDTPGLADICLVPQVFSAQRFGADISTLKRVNAIYDACQALPAFADAHPAKQPDAEP